MWGPVHEWAQWVSSRHLNGLQMNIQRSTNKFQKFTNETKVVKLLILSSALAPCLVKIGRHYRSEVVRKCLFKFKIQQGRFIIWD